MGKYVDMTDWIMKEHGVLDSRLTVLNDSGKRGSGGVFWNCKCECGKLTCVSGGNLRNGNTKSCGCLSKDNTVARNTKNNTINIGDRYDNLTVIQDLGLRYPTVNSKKRRRYFLCQCDCGNYIEVMGNELQTGHKGSCGCLHSKGEQAIIKILNENNIKFDHDKLFPQLYKDTQRKLRFDFIIYNDDNTINRFVEFDGRQHITGMDKGLWSQSETLETIQERDNIKNNWCLNNGYTLIRIPYSRLPRLCLNDIITDKYVCKGDG